MLLSCSKSSTVANANTIAIAVTTVAAAATVADTDIALDKAYRMLAAHGEREAFDYW